MDLLKQIQEYYILSHIDRDFSIGLRSNLRYAHVYRYTSLMEINPGGCDPFEYLSFAKADILTNDTRGAINALGNTKKALHLIIDCFFEVIGLKNIVKKLNFPDKLEIISQLEAFPINTIKNLNTKRNFVEHEYKKISISEANDFIDITEMFVRLCYPFLKHMITGIHVGIKGEERDICWILETEKKEINIVENLGSNDYIDSPIGKIPFFRGGFKILASRKKTEPLRENKN